MSSAVASTVNQLREAFAVQRLYERDARGGTRYTEIIQSHFGVINQDARLQRAEYLGGSRHFINVTTVPQTSASTEASKQGNLAAYSVTSSHSGFSKTFPEHGFVFGFLAITADLSDKYIKNIYL